MNAQQDSYGNYTPIQKPQAPPPPALAGGIVFFSGNPNGSVTAAPDTIGFDIVGDVFYFTANGTTWTAISGGSSSGTQVFSGNGNPNGVVTATEPALYYDKSTQILYDKTGSGNSGWN